MKAESYADSVSNLGQKCEILKFSCVKRFLFVRVVDMRKKEEMKKRISKTLSIMAAGALTLAVVPMSSVYAEEGVAKEEVKTFNLKQDDENILETLKKEYIELEQEDSDFNIETSDIEVNGLDKTKVGLQNVLVKISLKDEDGKENTVGYDHSENVIVNIEKSSAPALSLKQEEITLDHDAEWNPYAYIAETYTASGNLPVLREMDNVDTSIDGEYSVSLTAIDEQGNTTTKTMKVVVRMSEAQIAAKEAEEATQAAAEAQAIAAQQATIQTTTTIVSIATNGANPYSGGWSNCTWSAWQACYNARGISLPMWGDAGSWLANAAGSGYATGSTPVAGSIVVLTYHVAYVASVSEDGQQVYVIEGGYNGAYHEGWQSAYGYASGQAILGYIYC